MRSTIACTVMGVLLVGAPARAQTSMASIVRGVGAGSDKAAASVAHFTRELFRQDARFRTVNLVEVLGSPTYDRASQAFALADEMFTKGKEAYESLDLDVAVEELNNALSKYERNAAYVTDFDKVASVLMLLGATHILRGEEKTGQRRLAQAIAILPGVEPDPRVFNPGMRQVFDQAGKDLAARPTGVLSITSNPSYGEVYIDGTFVGVTPLSVPDLPEGRHFVRVLKDGYRPWGKLLDVGGGADLAETASLKPTTNFDDFDTLASEAVAALRSEGERAPDAVDQLGVLLNIDHLYLCEVRLDGEKVEMEAALYDLNRQRVVARANQSFPYDSSATGHQKEVQAFYDQHFSPAALGPSSGLGAPGDSGQGLSHAGSGICAGMSCEKLRTVVFAVTLSVGLGMMAAGSILWGLAAGENDVFRSLTQTAEQYQSVRDGGMLKAVLGDVFFFTGVAAAATSLIIFAVWDPAPGAAEVLDSSGKLTWGVAPTPGGASVAAAWTF